MMETLHRLLDLFSQLLEIGVVHPEVLVAAIIFAIAVVIAAAAVVCTVVLCIPITIIYWVVRFFKWVYWRVYPDRKLTEEYDEDYEEEPRHSRRTPIKDEQDKTLEPIYPDWMNKKGGRLL